MCVNISPTLVAEGTVKLVWGSLNSVRLFGKMHLGLTQSEQYQTLHEYAFGLIETTTQLARPRKAYYFVPCIDSFISRTFVSRILSLKNWCTMKKVTKNRGVYLIMKHLNTIQRRSTKTQKKRDGFSSTLRRGTFSKG